MKILSPCLLLSFLFGTPAGAVTVLSRTETGSGFLAEKVRISSVRRHDGKGLRFDAWRVSAGGSRTVTGSDTDGEKTLNARDVAGEVSFTAGRNFDFFLGADASSVAEIAYAARGLNAGVGFSREFGDEDADFRPRVAAHLTFGGSTARQDVEIKILNRIYTRQVELEQRFTGLDAAWDALSWLTLSLQARQYRHDRDEDELRRAAQSRFLNFRAGALVDTLFNLPRSDSSVGLHFLWGEGGLFEAVFSRSQAVIDDSVTAGTELAASYDFRGGLILGARWLRSEVDLEGVDRADTVSAEIGWRF